MQLSHIGERPRGKLVGNPPVRGQQYAQVGGSGKVERNRLGSLARRDCDEYRMSSLGQREIERVRSTDIAGSGHPFLREDDLPVDFDSDGIVGEADLQSDMKLCHYLLLRDADGAKGAARQRALVRNGVKWRGRPRVTAQQSKGE